MYLAKVRSSRAKLIEIPKEVIMMQIKNYEKLKQDYQKCKSDLIFDGPPTIDFLIRYELEPKN